MTIKRLFLAVIGFLGGLLLMLSQENHVAVAITMPLQAPEQLLSGGFRASDAIYSSSGLAEEHMLDLQEWQVATLEMVVQQEAGFNYESALWVMTTILNRVDSADFPDSSWGVITQPGQFEAYGAGHYLRHRGTVTEETRQAIQDAIRNPQRVHAFTGFFTETYARLHGQEGVSIGGNTYFTWE